jgi:hypothetical protein
MNGETRSPTISSETCKLVRDVQAPLGEQRDDCGDERRFELSATEERREKGREARKRLEESNGGQVRHRGGRRSFRRAAYVTRA